MRSWQRLFDRTFWKFILVGIINTLVGTGVMFALYNLLHQSYWFSSAANYVTGSIVSFFLNKYFTFQNSEHSIGLCCGLYSTSPLLSDCVRCSPPAVRLSCRQKQSVQDNGAMLAGSAFCRPQLSRSEILRIQGEIMKYPETSLAARIARSLTSAEKPLSSK
jgi:hypothetical protein